MTLLDDYTSIYGEVLQPIAPVLEALTASHMRGLDHVDRITARAKSPDRFIAKAAKRGEDGSLKYSDPLSQIQDQLGVRVVVFYKGDVEVVSKEVTRYFRPIEMRNVVPETHWAFGYFGKHFVLALPSEAVPKGIELERAPDFFELQIKTLFQHAWSEAGHDLGYKPVDQLNEDQQRRLAFTAAQAWGADRVFEELAEELL